MEDIIQQFEEADKQHQQVAEEKRERVAVETAQAQEMRKQSLENFGETRKEKNDCGEQEKK